MSITPIYENPAGLLQQLIRFDTTNPPGNEAVCINYIDGLMKEAGLETTIVGKVPERSNLIARLKGRGEAPPLLLYGHVDVVTTANQEWQHPPFSGDLIDGYIWGRGAVDMKGGVAMMLAAFLRAQAEGLQPAGDVVITIVSDEEAGGYYGARYLVEEHAHLFEGIRHAIGEFGGFALYIGGQRFYPIMIAERQLCSLKATFRGRGGHGATPIRGGAMAKLGRFLTTIDENPLPIHITPPARMCIEAIGRELPAEMSHLMAQLLEPDKTDAVLEALGTAAFKFASMFRNTASPTIVAGGHKINVIPSEVTLEIDGRLLPGYRPDDLLAELRTLVGDEVSYEVTEHDPGPPEPDMTLFPALSSMLREADPAGIPVPYLLSGVTDARFFARLGIQTYGFLPMNLPPDFDFGRTIHAANERLPAEAVTFGANCLYRVLQNVASE